MRRVANYKVFITVFRQFDDFIGTELIDVSLFIVDVRKGGDFLKSY